MVLFWQMYEAACVAIENKAEDIAAASAMRQFDPRLPAVRKPDVSLKAEGLKCRGEAYMLLMLCYELQMKISRRILDSKLP